MTKRELIQVRESTYKPPPDRRCENCQHYWHYSGSCQAIEVRGKIVLFPVHKAGICDLFVYEKKTK